MKSCGLMITCNEEWIIYHSLYALLYYVDEILVLDASSDNTREILSKFDRVTVYNQEDYPVTNYGEYRQFLLEKGREKGYEYFVCLDADETLAGYLFGSDYEQLLKDLKVGWAYQMDVANFYSDTRHYTDKGRIGNKFIDVIFHDDGQMKYENRMVVHEKRTPATDYIKLPHDFEKYMVMHYGNLSQEKMNNRRKYYMLLEASNNIRSIDSINFDYLVNTCMSNYFNVKKLKKLRDGKFADTWITRDLKQDNGAHFMRKAYQIFKTDVERYSKLNLNGNMPRSVIIWRRIVELIKTGDLKVMFKSVRDYIVLDVFKKW